MSKYDRKIIKKTARKSQKTGLFGQNVAERVGFEPTIPFNQKLRRIICYCSDIRTTLASSF